MTLSTSSPIAAVWFFGLILSLPISTFAQTIPVDQQIPLDGQNEGFRALAEVYNTHHAVIVCAGCNPDLIKESLAVIGSLAQQPVTLQNTGNDANGNRLELPRQAVQLLLSQVGNLKLRTVALRQLIGVGPNAIPELIMLAQGQMEPKPPFTVRSAAVSGLIQNLGILKSLDSPLKDVYETATQALGSVAVTDSDFVIRLAAVNGLAMHASCFPPAERTTENEHYRLVIAALNDVVARTGKVNRDDVLIGRVASMALEQLLAGKTISPFSVSTARPAPTRVMVAKPGVDPVLTLASPASFPRTVTTLRTATDLPGISARP